MSVELGPIFATGGVMALHHARRRRARLAQLGALVAAVGLAIWLGVSCQPERDADVDLALDAIEDSADRARASLDADTIDRGELRAAAEEMVVALYLVERCAKEGHLRSSVYLSDRIGRLDAASRHTDADATLREEARPILEEIERLVAEARAEAAKHPRPLRGR